MKIADLDYKLKAEGIFLWQYANALRLNRILQNEIDYYGESISKFVEDWQHNVFNLLTANTFGLELWGKILKAPRPLVKPLSYVIDSETTLRFYNPNSMKWHSIWLSDNVPTLNVETSTPSIDNLDLPLVYIDDNVYRRCLVSKLFLLHSNASINDINFILDKIYNFGVEEDYKRNISVTDNFDMTMSVNFGFTPTDTDLVILTTNAFSPRPMGVKFNYGVKEISKNTFSFNEMRLGTWGTNENTQNPTLIAQGLGTFYNI